MDWTELLACKTRSQQEEALTKQISCALSPAIGRWLSWPLMLARKGPIAIGDIVQREIYFAGEARSAKRFCDEWGIELVSAYGDRRSGFELLAYKWGDRGELVFIGSDDALDWWRNLTDKAIGLSAFTRNLPEISRAIASLLERGCTTLTARGHSLGGGLGMMAYLHHPSISRCVTYQSTAIAPPFQDANPDRDGVTHYFHRDDLIPSLSVRKTKGWFVPGKKIIWEPEIRYRHALRIKAHRMLLSTQLRP